MDVLEVSKEASNAAEHCRSGKGPFILEMKHTDTEGTLCPIQQNIGPEKKFRR